MKEKSSMMGIPVGIDDFRQLRESGGYFVDKSLFIKEIWDDLSAVKLIIRPQRFGKSLNLSMLRYFFEDVTSDTGKLFKELKIWQQGSVYQRAQNQYPVVYLTFKDVHYRSYKDCYEQIKIIMGEEYRRHDYILDNKKIDSFDKRIFEEIMNEKAEYVRINTSLRFLTNVLRDYHEKEVIVLIDEYDTPINQGYLHGYCEEILDFTLNFLGAGLKSNSAMKMAVLTGVFRTARESMFSGFNNVKVYSMLQERYADLFGFTEDEVVELLRHFQMEEMLDVVKEWYKGYHFGESTIIYNPWSILNFVSEKKAQPFWINTGSDDFIRQILMKTDVQVKQKLRRLLAGEKLSMIRINPDTNLRDIYQKTTISEDLLWSLLLVSGYLTFSKLQYTGDGDSVCDLVIPNQEVLKMYRDVMTGVMSS